MGKLKLNDFKTQFHVTFDNNYGRPCLISKPTKEDQEHKEKAMFHEWFVIEDVVSPRFNTSKNPLPWGQHSSIVGLVELEDGRMTLITPRMITFTDDKVSKLFSDDDIYTIGSNFTAGLSNGIEKTACVFDEKEDQKYPKHVEEFIKMYSFDFLDENWRICSTRRILKCITVDRFIEALSEYFVYKWDESKFYSTLETPEKSIEEFVRGTCWFDSKESVSVSNDPYIMSDRMIAKAIISNITVKDALKRYFNYEWKDEIYDKY